MTETKEKRPGRWKSGESGNPNGRPPGNGKVQKLREGLAKDLPVILRVLSKAAKAGDMQAAKLILERVLPPMKPIEQAVELPPMDGSSITDQGRAVLAAVTAGRIAPTQGSQLLAAIGTLAKVSEVDELLRRIEALERQQLKTKTTGSE